MRPVRTRQVQPQPLPVPGDDSAPSAPHSLSRTRTRRRAKHKRSFNGCSNCLARRKKCDELLPRCGECQRLDLLCSRGKQEAPSTSVSAIVVQSTDLAPAQAVPLYGSQFDDLPDVHWVPTTDLAQLPELEFDSAWLSPSSAAGGEGADIALGRMGAEETHSDDRTSAHKDHSTQPTDPSVTWRYLRWVAMMDENIVPEVTRPGHLHASSAMQRRAADGGGRSVSHDEQTPTTIANDPVLEYFVGAAGKAAVRQWPPTEQHLLNHFVQHVARALVVVYDDNVNPILRHLVPRALDDDRLCIRYAMLALAGSHLCKLYPNFEDSLVLQRSLALNHLKETISLSTASENEDAFTATVLLCLLEICQGNSHKWILHLHGAHALLATCGPLDEKKTGNALMTFMVDVYNSILYMSRLTAINITNIPNAHALSLSETSSASIHPVFGLANPIYAILVNCSNLLADRAAIDSTDIINHTGRQLVDWTCSIATAEYPLRELLAAAEAVRWAGLLWLLHAGHRSMGKPIVDVDRQNFLNRVLDAVGRIRPGSVADPQLLFPLFMAGVCAHRKSERLRIEYRLTVLESTVGMGNITAAHIFLDDFWRRWNEGLGDTGWQSLLSSNLVLW